MLGGYRPPLRPPTSFKKNIFFLLRSPLRCTPYREWLRWGGYRPPQGCTPYREWLCSFFLSEKRGALAGATLGGLWGRRSWAAPAAPAIAPHFVRPPFHSKKILFFISLGVAMGGLSPPTSFAPRRATLPTGSGFARRPASPPLAKQKKSFFFERRVGLSPPALLHSLSGVQRSGGRQSPPLLFFFTSLLGLSPHNYRSTHCFLE
jgi:hypothetical protein